MAEGFRETHSDSLPRRYHSLTPLLRLSSFLAMCRNLVRYQNTAFYNPVTQQHERVTMHFLSSYLPTRGRGGDVATDRAWRIEWSSMFFQMCRATGGSLLFDLDLYPASRRLFLKLKDRFWRSKRVFLNVDDLTINGLGFSADRPLKKRKFDLLNCIRELPLAAAVFPVWIKKCWRNEWESLGFYAVFGWDCGSGGRYGAPAIRDRF